MGSFISSAPALRVVSTASIATTSGTDHSFTALPSGIRRVTASLRGVSLNSTGSIEVRIGTSAGFVATGYSGSGGYYNSGSPASASVAASTTGALVAMGGAAIVTAATVVFDLVDPINNIWSYRINQGFSSSNSAGAGCGFVTLPAALDRVGIFATGGNTFDAGAFSANYEVQ